MRFLKDYMENLRVNHPKFISHLKDNDYATGYKKKIY